ncbi:hypothetical protein C369_00343, partial [Cryptococcus neoformans A5-35-17]
LNRTIPTACICSFRHFASLLQQLSLPILDTMQPS